jgi:hypothetical protein
MISTIETFSPGGDIHIFFPESKMEGRMVSRTSAAPTQEKENLQHRMEAQMYVPKSAHDSCSNMGLART